MNLQKMMKQAQQMQAKLQEVQTEMEAKEFEGTSGGGMVKVTLTGKGAMTRIALDAELLKADEKDMLEDLIVAAHNDAKKKSEDGMNSALGDLTGGLQLPPGFKMPF